MEKRESDSGRELTNHAAGVTDLIQYQPESIVSRSVIKKESGSVTIFAFDQGQALSEHTAPYDALVQVIEGEVEITLSGRKQRLKGAELILMPANQPHALGAVTRFKMILTMLRS